jgi:hypothetical protein
MAIFNSYVRLPEGNPIKAEWNLTSAAGKNPGSGRACAARVRRSAFDCSCYDIYRIYKYLCMCICIYVCVFIYIYIFVKYIYICMYIFVYMYIYIYYSLIVFMCMYIYICVYTYVFVHVFVYTCNASKSEYRM